MNCVTQTGTDVLGTYSVVPFTDYSLAGTYLVSIVGVTLNGVVVSSFTGNSTFELVVSTLCPTTTLSWAIAPASFTYNVTAAA